MTDRLDPDAEDRFWENVRTTAAFFVGTDPVHAALHKMYLEAWEAVANASTIE